MATQTKVIGPISAYAIAVQEGYTGSKAEWAEAIVNAQENAQTAQEAADRAQSLTESLPQDFTDTVANFAPTYSTSAPYAVGDYVIHNGLLYRCTTAIASGEAWTSGHWTQVNVGGELENKADEIGALKSTLDQVVGAVYDEESVALTITNPYYWDIETGTATLTRLAGTNWMAANSLVVAENETYRIRACQGATNKARIWVVTDDDYNIISMADNYYGNDVKDEILTIPNGGKKLMITSTSSGDGIVAPYMWLWKETNKINENAIEIENINNEILGIEDKIAKKISITPIMNAVHYWNIETQVAVYTEIRGSNWQASTPINVSEGETFTIKACQGNTRKTRIWVVTDNDLNIIGMAEDYYGLDIKEETVIIPSGGTKLLITNTTTGLSYPDVEQKIYAIDVLDDKPLKGKKLSLLGDSISAYTGTIPAGNTPYYTGNNSGVTSPNQMWWKILCDKTEMIPLIINGWSGSGINWQTDSSHAAIVPMSDDSRCNGLHDGTTMPDVILIAGGVNDYTYAQYAQNEPLDWDGKSVPGYTEQAEGKQVYNSFTEAYVAMIKKLQTNYPNAIVVALSTWFTMRGTDNGYILTHTVGQNVYTQQEYNDKIRYVAEQMHIPYIDVSNIGFNRNNFYPNYAVDSSSIPTHPNAAGQAVMGKAIAEKLVALVGGFLT